MTPPPTILWFLIIFAGTFLPCQALSYWSTILITRADILVRINETHFYVVGNINGVILVAEYNTNGVQVASWMNASESHLIQPIKAELTSSGGLVIVLKQNDNILPESSFGILRFAADLKGPVVERAYPEAIVMIDGIVCIKEDSLVFLEKGSEGGRALTEINFAGELLWSRDLQDGAHTVVFAKTMGRSRDIVYFSNDKHTSVSMHILTPAEDRKMFTIPDMMVYSAVETRYDNSSAEGKAFVLVGSCHRGNTWAEGPCAVKLDAERGQPIWVWQGNGPRGPDRVFENFQGDYIVYNSGPPYSLVTALSSSGAAKWRWRIKKQGLHPIRGMIELGKQEYVYVNGNWFALEKTTLSARPELLRCEYLEECRTCPMGSYWNYTGCISCPAGCGICVAENLCEVCLSAYAAGPDGRCVPSPKKANRTSHARGPACNCTGRGCCVEGNLCGFAKGATSVPHHTKCRCDPATSTDNGTHCILLRRQYLVQENSTAQAAVCSELCSACLPAEEGGYCVECANLPHSMVHRTGKFYVDCRCQFGWTTVNRSAGCVPVNIAADTSSPQKPRSGGFGLVFCAAAAAAVVLGIAAVWTACRRRPLRTPQKIDTTQQDAVEIAVVEERIAK